MKRYIDFQFESWPDRTDSRMQAARWEACLEGLGSEAPCAGVIDTWPIDLLGDLIDEKWVSVPHAPSDLLLRRAARKAVMASLSDDLDCLSPVEHTLVERMLIGDGRVFLETVPEFEAAYTLRMRLWCDVGVYDDRPCACLDGVLMKALPDLLMRQEHLERRSRVFIYDGMMHGLLYLSGFLDDRLPRRRFIEEVLRREETPETSRVAKNYLEASFDCCEIGGCTLLLHTALASPESLIGTLAAQGAFQMPSVTPWQLAGSMNGLLPEEDETDTKMRLALSGGLRPEYEPEDAVSDLRLLAKQGATLDVLRDVMAGMLCVLPTAHMENALVEMSFQTPRWVSPWAAPAPPSHAATGTVGLLH